nr:AzlC family ABC transporter permease [uncultured Pseudokineococcus sp.]
MGLEPDLARDAGVAALAAGVVGVAFGAVSVAADLPLWAPVLMSVVVFAGASQFLLVGLLAAGAGPLAAVAAALLVNARHLPFGMALADVVGRGGPWQRALAAHLLIDESAAMALAQRDPGRRRRAFWACGLFLFAAWNVGVLAGATAGSALDTTALGLDAALPALLLALVLPALRDDAGTRRAALAGAVLAVVLTPVLPAGLPVLVALLGLVLLGRTRPATPVRVPEVSA